MVPLSLDEARCLVANYIRDYNNETLDRTRSYVSEHLEPYLSTYCLLDVEAYGTNHKKLSA